MTRHELKIKKRYFDDQISGVKNFELHKLDREFVVGDELKLNEVSLKDGEYSATGNYCIVKINSILTQIEGLTLGYGILGTELIEKHISGTTCKTEYFVYCPNSGFEKFNNTKDRDDHAEDCIQGYLDDTWDEEVAEVCSGIITHNATQTDLTKRPDDIDEDGCDGLGAYWAEWDYTCNYELLPVGSTKEQAA